ncbi:sulfotransferase family protein [Maricaulis salignorans]|uniref:sulfotransferase family protein n=1 Tax=Maricaulis salignorans TaxID=144026 RepID=UPI003A957588
MKPNFLYLGGDKCGSTWLHRLLSLHPDTGLPSSKELFFFDRYFERGTDWYTRQFEGLDAPRVGEICHDYLYSPVALERIADFFEDDAVFLIFLRNPYLRTISHHRYLQRIGKTTRSLDAALETHTGLTSHSLYLRPVQQAINLLGRDRIKVLKFEDLASDPLQFGQSVSDALGIRFIADLPYQDRVLEGSSARSAGLVRILRSAGWRLRDAGLQSLVGSVKSHPLVERLLFQGGSARTSSQDARVTPRIADLVRQFHDEAIGLEEVCGLDFSDWRETLESVAAPDNQ